MKILLNISFILLGLTLISSLDFQTKKSEQSLPAKKTIEQIIVETHQELDKNQHKGTGEVMKAIRSHKIRYN